MDFEEQNNLRLSMEDGDTYIPDWGAEQQRELLFLMVKFAKDHGPCIVDGAFSLSQQKQRLIEIKEALELVLSIKQ